jgi:poly(A) polymerase Pap1
LDESLDTESEEENNMESDKEDNTKSEVVKQLSCMCFAKNDYKKVAKKTNNK